ncbi:MAG: hypothetical protein HYX78_12260 [Armatimonadetes bacterium]|nr:hypothetical protein [Armatimonadota bacterium]
MLTARIGFIPSHRVGFSQEWAVRMRGRCIEQMRRIEGMELVTPDEETTKLGLVQDHEDARACLRLFREKRVAGVVLGGMTFGHETSAVGGIVAHLPQNTPVLHFATRGADDLREDRRASDSWCGQFMMTSALKRRGIRFEHIPTCFPEDPVFGQWIERFVRACIAIDGFRGARIGQIGTRPEEFESVWWNEASLQKKFNQEIVPIDLDDFFSRVEAILPNDVEVHRIEEETRSQIDATDVPTDAMNMIARYELALMQLFEEKRLQAVAINCWLRVQHRLGISVCSALARLTDRGFPCACEVDVYGASTMLAAYLASKGRIPPHIIDWTDLHPSEPNVFLAWHCGNAPPSLCAGGCCPKLARHPIPGFGEPYGILLSRLREGPVTLCRLVEYDDEFTMFISRGEVIQIDPETGGSGGWIRVSDIGEWERLMVQNGVIPGSSTKFLLARHFKGEKGQQVSK